MSEEQKYAAIDALIERQATSPPINHMELWEKAKEERRANITQMFDEGITWGEAMGAHPILIQSEEAFRKELQSIKQDLNAQIDIFAHGLNEYFKTGDHPPPYYPMRIAIILRKQKQNERERLFLAAYCKHFATKRGSRTDEKIMARATGLGAYTTSKTS